MYGHPVLVIRDGLERVHLHLTKGARRDPRGPLIPLITSGRRRCHRLIYESPKSGCGFSPTTSCEAIVDFYYECRPANLSGIELATVGIAPGIRGRSRNDFPLSSECPGILEKNCPTAVFLSTSEREAYRQNRNVVGGMEGCSGYFESAADGASEAMPQAKLAEHEARGKVYQRVTAVLT